jgi:hypothetical protein
MFLFQNYRNACLREQFRAGQRAMAVLGGFEQEVLQAGASAMRRISGNAEFVRDFVGGLEADAAPGASA